MSRQEKVPKDWRAEFVELRNRLLEAGHDLDLSHEVIVTERGLGPYVEQIARILEVARGREPVKRICVQLDNEATEEHFFYAEHPSIFDSYRRLLDGIVRLRDKVPTTIAPKQRPIGSVNRSDDALVRWLRFLFYLSWKFPKHTLKADLNYSFDEPNEVQNFRAIASAESIDDNFDPWLYVSELEPPERSLASWRSEFRSSGKRFPSMLNAHFTKDLFYASANGIDIMLLEAAAIPAKAEKQQRTTVSAENLKFLMMRALLEHHKPFDAEPCEIPLKQKDWAKKLKWSGSMVTRGMEMIFKRDGMYEYRDLCESGQILFFLRGLELREFKEWARNQGANFEEIIANLVADTE